MSRVAEAVARLLAAGSGEAAVIAGGVLASPDSGLALLVGARVAVTALDLTDDHRPDLVPLLHKAVAMERDLVAVTLREPPDLPHLVDCWAAVRRGDGAFLIIAYLVVGGGGEAGLWCPWSDDCYTAGPEGLVPWAPPWPPGHRMRKAVRRAGLRVQASAKSIAATYDPAGTSRSGFPAGVDPRRYNEGALRLFERAMDAWGATDNQRAAILGLRSVRTLERWRGRPPRSLAPVRLSRIGAVLGIWRSILIVLGSPGHARHWIVNPNALFGGRSPLEVMGSGKIADLQAVRALAHRERLILR